MHSSQSEFADAGSGLTDKISQHGYHRFYPWFLREFKGKPVRLLEIGLDQLGSVALWRRYFGENLDLHGIDRDEKQVDGGNVTIHKLDQSDAGQLRAFVASVGVKFDVILDDGSHIPEHQLLSLEILWTLLAPGGIYILEDIETSWWGKSELYGYRFDARDASGNLVAQLRSAVDAINFEFLSGRKRRKLAGHRLKGLLQDIEMMSIGQNCLILLKKDSSSFGQFYDRNYLNEGRIMARHRPTTAFRRIRRDGVGGFLRHVGRKLLGSGDV